MKTNREMAINRFPVHKQFDCDSFVDNVFINISALVHIDMIIDAVNFVIEIRAVVVEAGFGQRFLNFLAMKLCCVAPQNC